MSWLPIVEIAKKVQSGELKATDLVEQSLKVIAEKQEFNAIIATLDESARKRAAEIDERVLGGEKIGRLAGVPFIAKDNFLVFGGETTAASNILKGFVAPYQAIAIEKLEAEGAICVAKANLDAFAHGSSTEHSDMMTTKHPTDPSRVPGGSSGGSAAAVMLDMAPFALGTETGGSIRLPASFTGAVGYKPTYGLVSRFGVIAMASSNDVIGPLTKTVDDAALVLDVMSGKDEHDSTTIECEEQVYPTDATDLKGVRIGVIKEYLEGGVDPGVKSSIQQAIEQLRVAGADIKDVSIPTLPLALAVYYIVVPAEVSSNLSRYDGQRFGYSHPDAKTLEEAYEMSRSVGFGAEAKRRIMIGAYVLSSGYYDAYYKKALEVRTKLIQEFDAVFQDVDVLIGPVAPETAFKIGEHSSDPLKMYLTDIMTVAANLIGIPAISVPGPEVNGLPVGVQLMAPQRKDKYLLSVAKAYETISKGTS